MINNQHMVQTGRHHMMQKLRDQFEIYIAQGLTSTHSTLALISIKEEQVLFINSFSSSGRSFLFASLWEEYKLLDAERWKVIDYPLVFRHLPITLR